MLILPLEVAGEIEKMGDHVVVEFAYCRKHL
jgi:hypothetical protein